MKQPLPISLVLLSTAATSLFTFGANAQAPLDEPLPTGGGHEASEPFDTAAALFDEGIRLAAEKRYEAAAAAFDEVYKRWPEPGALYNLGLAYLSMGDNVRALQTLEAYLLQTNASTSPDRLAAVGAQIARLRSTVGGIVLTLHPADAITSVDGASIASTDKTYVSPGKHTLEIRREGYVKATRHITVHSGETLQLEVALKADTSLLLRCPVPDVLVSVNGVPALTTDGLTTARLGPVPLPVHLEFRRAGYQTHTMDLSRRVDDIECQLRPLHKTARLSLDGTPGRKWLLDGQPFTRGDMVPEGRHVITELDVDGSQKRWQVTASAGDNRFRIGPPLQELRPTRTASSVSYWLLGAGAVLSAAAAGVLYYNTQRNQAWIDSGRDPSSAESLQTSVERWDENAYYSLGGGALLMTVGLVVHFDGEGLP